MSSPASGSRSTTAPASFSIRADGIIIRITYLILTGLLIDGNQLTAGRQYCNAWTSADLDLRVTERREHRHRRRALIRSPALQHSFTCFDFAAARDDRSPWRDRLLKSQLPLRHSSSRVSSTCCTLSAPAGTGAPVMILHCLARASSRDASRGRPLTHRRFSNAPVTLLDVAGANRVTIHLRAIEGRQIGISNDILGENIGRAPRPESTLSVGEWASLRLNNLDGFSDRDHFSRMPLGQNQLWR